MKVFIIQKAQGLYASSGEYIANYCVLRHLASLGHATGQLSFALDGEIEQQVEDATTAGIDANLSSNEFWITATNGEEKSIKVWSFTNVDGVRTVALDAVKFREIFPAELQAKETREYIDHDIISPRIHAFTLLINTHLAFFQATHIMFSDALSLKATTTMPLVGDPRRIFIIHCAEQLPFGPYAGGIPDSACSPIEHELLRKCDGIWSVSQAIKDYATKYGKLDTRFLLHHPWLYRDKKTGKLPEQRYNWDKEAVGMINPSNVKGAKVLIETAKRLPHQKFIAWRSWAFDKKIGQELEQLDNVELRPTQTDMDKVWSDVKVLIVPSLWLEAWGIVVIEAQIRGIPVIASNAGALAEAKLGIPYIVPVNAITGEHDKEDHYVIADQDVEPWAKAIEKLMNDKEEYDKISKRAREETVSWIKRLDENAIENWLESLKKKEKMNRIDERAVQTWLRRTTSETKSVVSYLREKLT